jgi:hypothetical protein
MFAAALGVRFVYLIYGLEQRDPTRSHLPSLILLTLLATFGLALVIAGIFAELIRSQRRLTEEVLYQTKLRAAARGQRSEDKDQ